MGKFVFNQSSRHREEGMRCRVEEDFGTIRNDWIGSERSRGYIQTGRAD